MNEEMKKKIKKDIVVFLKYQAMFLETLIYLELMLRLLTIGKISAGNFWFLLFMPAFSMFFAALGGFVKRKIGRIVTPVIVGLITFFYFSQFMYFKVFNSFWSVSMMGMAGTATVNFGKVLIPTFFKNFFLILLLNIPLILTIVVAVTEVVKFKRYWLPIHIAAFVLFIPVWMLGVLCLRINGNEKNSPYYVYASEFANTDMTIEKYGAISTFLIEMGFSHLNFGAPQGEGININPTGGLDIFVSNTPSPTPTCTPEPTQPGATATPTPTSTPTPTPIETWSYDVDWDALAADTDNEEIKELCAYFASLEPSQKNDYTGMFEGYNLIYICAEAFWTYACNEAFTPTLYKMANNGIILNNYYNSFLNTTCNGEFAFATSLWPDVGRTGVHNGADTGSFAQSYKNYMPYGLGNLFNNLGYKSYGIHNNIGSYYARNKSWPNLGYTTKFEKEGNVDGMTFDARWVNSDLDMMLQSVDDFINDDHFNVYYMTYSGHGPYTITWDNENIHKNIDEAREINQNYGYKGQALYYLAAHMELDKALEYLLQRLEEAGKLENTVIVLAGDHFPYFLTDQDAINQLSGQDLDMNVDKFKSTCIIYNAGMKDNIYVDTYCDNVDILPTILNLFNVEFDSRLLAGRDIFAPNVVHKAMLGNYVGVNKGFVTDVVKYDGDNDVATWTIDTSGYTAEQLQEYLDSMENICMNEFKASLKMMNNDFYRYFYDHLGQ